MSGGPDAAAEIERLLADAEQLPDPHARALARALAAALVDLVGAGLQRVVAIGGDELARRLADDELVGSLMVLAGMHPDGVAVRAAHALDAAAAELGDAGAVVAGVDALGEGVRVRLSAARDATRARAMVEAIVVGRAPDCEHVVVELAGARLVEQLRVLP
jgi:hypothetical protein